MQVIEKKDLDGLALGIEVIIDLYFSDEKIDLCIEEKERAL